MEAKLKALKVPELKQILTRAGVPIPTKANKADLIAKIISEPGATAVANGEDPSSTNGHAETPAATSSKPANTTASSLVEDEKLKDLLAPPEEFDWDSAEQPTTTINDTKTSTEKTNAVDVAQTTLTATITPDASATVASSEPTTTAAKADESTADTATGTSTDAALEKEKQLELHKARAARFGIPFVEPKFGETKTQRTKRQPPPTNPARAKPSNVANGKSGKPAAVAAAPSGNSEAQLKARAERFGTKETAAPSTDAKATSGRKRAAEEVVDPEELERRKKRAERFGMPVRT